MGVQDEISKYLQEGYTPQQIIKMGYKKSTVYKVYETLKTYLTKVGKSDWCITNIRFNKPRYLPEEKISVSFNFENTSGKEIYLYQIGIWVEWLKPDEWYAQEVRDLVKSSQKRFFSFLIPIPNDIPLGEYELRFGIKAQYLPIMEYRDQTLQVQWSEPEIIHIKHPLTGIKMFISHSTLDMPLIRQLEQHLDNYGIEPIIAEDMRTPGVPLREKFQEKIREATIFLVLFTEESIRSKWVIEETNYALKIGKPIIPLKEESVRIKLDIEWIEFSKYDKPETIFSKIMDGINSRLKKVPQINVPIGILILAFLAGLFLGWGSKE
jgi:hypothetical protein